MEVKICPLMMAFYKATRDCRCCRGLCSWWNAEKGRCAVSILAEVADHATDRASKLPKIQAKEDT